MRTIYVLPPKSSYWPLHIFEHPMIRALARPKHFIITKTIKEQYEVRFTYPQMNDVMRLVKEFDLEIVNTDFQMDCKLIFAVRKSKSEGVLKTFKDHHELSVAFFKN